MEIQYSCSCFLHHISENSIRQLCWCKDMHCDCFVCLQDYENIRMGLYKLPWDMTTSGHKQTNPLNIIDKFSRYSFSDSEAYTTWLVDEQILSSAKTILRKFVLPQKSSLGHTNTITISTIHQLPQKMQSLQVSEHTSSWYTYGSCGFRIDLALVHRQRVPGKL